MHPFAPVRRAPFNTEDTEDPETQRREVEWFRGRNPVAVYECSTASALRTAATPIFT
jgi:hypothetical protein